jgi:hypothetical protein
MMNMIYTATEINHRTKHERVLAEGDLLDVSVVVAERLDKLEGDVVATLRNLSPRLYPRVGYDASRDVEVRVTVR